MSCCLTPAPIRFRVKSVATCTSESLQLGGRLYAGTCGPPGLAKALPSWEGKPAGLRAPGDGCAMHRNALPAVRRCSGGAGVGHAPGQPSKRTLCVSSSSRKCAPRSRALHVLFVVACPASPPSPPQTKVYDRDYLKPDDLLGQLELPVKTIITWTQVGVREAAAAAVRAAELAFASRQRQHMPAATRSVG